jgi:multiple sugar transport system permease protein
MNDGDLLHVVTNDSISDARRRFGRAIVWVTGGLLLLVAAAQAAQTAGWAEFGFSNWRPTLYAYCTWAVALCWGQVQ